MGRYDEMGLKDKGGAQSHCHIKRVTIDVEALRSASIGAWEVKLEMMTNRRTDRVIGMFHFLQVLRIMEV